MFIRVDVPVTVQSWVLTGFVIGVVNVAVVVKINMKPSFRNNTFPTEDWT